MAKPIRSSPNDEFADYETWDKATWTSAYPRKIDAGV